MKWTREQRNSWSRQHRPRYTDLSPEERRKDNARSIAGVYLRRGKITRKPCHGCGGEKVEMHHPDYSKPLEIVWLCRPCHMAEHRRLDALAA